MFTWAKRTLGFERRGALSHPSAQLLAILGVDNAELSCSPQTALRSPTALACVSAISQCVGTLPVHIFQRGNGDARTRDREHGANKLLGAEANPWTSRTDLFTALQLDALTSINGFGAAQIVRVDGKPREFHRLNPSNVTPKIDEGSLEPFFEISGTGTKRLPWQDVLFIATPGWTHDRPLSLFNEAKSAIALDLEMAKAQSRIFKNGTRPSGTLTHPKPLGVDAKKRIQDSLTAWRQGDTAGGVLVLDEGIIFTPFEFKSTDAQFLECRKLCIAEIARAYRVPLPLVGDLERAVWKNLEQLAQQFLTFAMLPWLECWKAALERALLTPEERQTHFLEFILDDLLRADIAARFAAYRAACGGSFLERNEVRALENMPPHEDGSGLLNQAGQTDAAPAPKKEGEDESA
jgi:HK97 family phage portal protein